MPVDMLRRPLVVALLLALSLPGDSAPRIPDLCGSVPDLDPAAARHIAFDDDRAFQHYCQAVGLPVLSESYERINNRIWYIAPDSFPECFRKLSPYLERLAKEAALLGRSEWIRDVEHRRELRAEGISLNRRMQELVSLQSDVTMSLQARAARYRRLIVEFDQLGYGYGAIFAKGELATVVAQLGDTHERTVLLQSGFRQALELDDGEMMCQFLGEIGYDRRRAGNIDSMLICYMQGIVIADRHHLPSQAVRLRLRLATHYTLEGRLAVAANVAREAQSVCRQWGGWATELRVVQWMLGQYADLGCWDVVRRVYCRFPVALRDLERFNHDREFKVQALKARYWEARLLAAQGKPDEAEAILSELLAPLRRLDDRGWYAPVQAERAEAMLAAGRPREALKAVDQGIAFADSFRLADARERLALIRARGALALGDVDLAEAALRDARSRCGAREQMPVLSACECDAIEVAIMLARGQESVARRKLDRGMCNLRETVRCLDAGPHSYMALAQAEDLRSVGHRLLSNDAAASCRFELDWQSLSGRMGRRDLGPSQAAAGTPEPGPARTRCIHVIYAFTSDSLTRWTCTPHAVRREVLPASRAECDQRVERAMRLFARDPGPKGAPMPDSLRTACVDLGLLLLPPELHEDPGARLVVTAEGSIARVPFEALDIGPGPCYVPLLACHDVVYARPERPVARRTGDGTSVILLGDDRRGEGTPLPSLVAAEDEARRAVAGLPRGRIVRSSEISKRGLLDAWSRASFLYVASHLIRDPEAPLLCYFPMQFGARQYHPEDAYLDLRDACSVDLSGCELAVLSSCASGEPYVVGDRAGPSMADALLDAGAHAVIHTRWQVRDDRAAIVAPRLAQAWLRGGNDPVAEWCASRRAMLRNASQWRHPFEWAAWSVTVRLPAQPWRAESGNVMASESRPGPSARAGPAANREPSESPR